MIHLVLPENYLHHGDEIKVIMSESERFTQRLCILKKMKKLMNMISGSEKESDKLKERCQKRILNVRK